MDGLDLFIGMFFGGMLVFVGVVLGVSVERTKKSHVFNQYISSPQDGIDPVEVYRQTKKIIDTDDTPESARRMD